MKHKLRKILIIGLVAVVALCCFGCDGANLYVYDQSDGEKTEMLIELEFGATLKNALESSAAQRTDSLGNTGKWTLFDYFNVYFAAVDDLYDTQTEYRGMQSGQSGSSVYSYDIIVPHDSELGDAVMLEEEYRQKTNFFIRAIHYTREDRFDYFVNEFKNAYDLYNAGERPSDGEALLPMNMLLFGMRVYAVVSDEEAAEKGYLNDGDGWYFYRVPAVIDAFPVMGTLLDTWTNLRAANLIYASSRMKSSGIKIESGSGAWYMFERLLGGTGTGAELLYYRADAAGWYLLAAVIGSLTTLFIILYCRHRRKPKKTETKPADLFPYDPFDGY